MSSRVCSLQILKALTIRGEAAVQEIRVHLEQRLLALGRKVSAIVDYDNFTVFPDALEAYIEMAHEVADRHYSRVSRYTTSALLRSKLGNALSQRGVSPHIFESFDEARRHLGS
jgi:propionate CoA-transferase